MQADPAAVAPGDPEHDDPLRWLEDVAGARALEWVQGQNARTRARFESEPGFAPLRARMQSILDAKDRIAYVQHMGGYYYNFWRDAEHPRGLWRRTTPAQYRCEAPQWEVLLDLDALAAAEGENWVWKGEHSRYPDWDRSLVHLSRGGADAVVVREFDLATRSFVRGGFELAEAKSDVHWIDRDEIYVGTDFGPGSLTESGYPRQVRRWRRGTPLAQARLVFEGAASDVAVGGYVAQSRGFHRELVRRSTTFYTGETWLLEGERRERIDVPEDAVLGFFGPQVLIRLRSAWNTGGRRYEEGSLLAADFEELRAGRPRYTELFVPDADSALEGYAGTRSHLVLHTLERVRGRLVEWRFDAGRWTRRDVAAPAFGSLGVAALDRDDSDAYFLTHVDFLAPDSLYLAQAGSDERERLKQRPAYFDASGLDIAQHEAVSRDGTRVPYFLVQPRAPAPPGGRATLLYGYGGFEVSLTPAYSAGLGAAWLERGGAYVLANIRGGGEFGPRWHEAALKERRQNAYDDFGAVAQDLVARGVTRPERLGIMGGSNGGLLVGVMLTQQPERFGAAVCQVPLLDMRRFHRLLAGASWMGEYGNPDDPADWDVLRRYSPYHNLQAGRRYPPVLFTTSTRDDRVHPGHARKMMARLQSLGAPDAWYFENTEGGHAGAADNRQLAYMSALEYTFLWAVLAPD